jgi:hypothetical protein
MDNRQKMDVVQYATGRSRIMPRDDEEDKLGPQELPLDPAIALPYLSSMCHWCVFEGCRPLLEQHLDSHTF